MNFLFRLINTRPTVTDRLAADPEKRKGLQTIFLCLIVCLVILLGVTVAVYFIDRNNASVPAVDPFSSFDP